MITSYCDAETHVSLKQTLLFPELWDENGHSLTALCRQEISVSPLVLKNVAAFLYVQRIMGN